MVDNSKSVRRMSRDQAAAAAVQLASVFLDANKDDRWDHEIVCCSPNSKPIGKAAARWLVGVSRIPRETTSPKIDGGNLVIEVDLVTYTASWHETEF